jgi:hypothetical protein
MERRKKAIGKNVMGLSSITVGPIEPDPSTMLGTGQADVSNIKL